MPRTRSLAFSELKIGIIGVSSIALAVLLIVAVGGQAGCFWQQFRVRTKFTNVQGMKTGAIVRVSGKDVGKVTSVEVKAMTDDLTKLDMHVVQCLQHAASPLVFPRGTAPVRISTHLAPR